MAKAKRAATKPTAKKSPLNDEATIEALRKHAPVSSEHLDDALADADKKGRREALLVALSRAVATQPGVITESKPTRVPFPSSGGGWVLEHKESELSTFITALRGACAASLTDAQIDNFAQELYAYACWQIPSIESTGTDSVRFKQAHKHYEAFKAFHPAILAAMEADIFSPTCDLLDKARIAAEQDAYSSSGNDTKVANLMVFQKLSMLGDWNSGSLVQLMNEIGYAGQYVEHVIKNDYPETAPRGKDSSHARLLAKRVVWKWRETTGEFPPLTKADELSAFTPVLNVVNEHLISPLAIRARVIEEKCVIAWGTLYSEIELARGELTKLG